MKKELSVPDQHVLKISRQSLRMNCVGVRIMGGPDHKQAADNILRITGKRVALDAGCSCLGGLR